MSGRFVLKFLCKDRMGIVADVSRFLFERRCNIVDSAQFGDPDNGLFFMVAAGRDLKSVVLARAVKWHAEHRILLNGQRTVIFH